MIAIGREVATLLDLGVCDDRSRAFFHSFSKRNMKESSLLFFETWFGTKSP